MTAGPHQYPHRTPAWWVVTTDNLPISGPHPSQSDAWIAYVFAVERLRAAMLRDRRYSARQIEARTRALRIGFGVLAGPWQHFASAKGSDDQRQQGS